jgi:uncharacterized protein
MEISLDTNQSTYQLRAYQAGKIQVNQTWFEHSIIIAPEKLISDWPPQTLNDLQTEHFSAIIELNPTLVILGSGNTLIFPSPALLAPFYNKQIGVEIMDTSAACRTYSILAAEGRNVVAALLIR